DLAASGRTASGKKSPETGQLTPAQILVKGAITHVQNDTSAGGGGIAIGGVRIGARGGKAEIETTIYMIDSTTGQVLASRSVTGSSTSRRLGLDYCCSIFSGSVDAFKADNVGKAILASVEEAVDWMTGQLPRVTWTGTVVLNREGKIYINRGEREGVEAGQVFVIGESEVIRDPDTGEVLDEIVDELARVKVETVREKMAICSVIAGKATDIDPGMAVHIP
ncbi:MAG TPA: CsgG/HfaB family protein, partial [Thermoanaerobaculia bacterium]|nr:CsgG/HfaB family protein [Thermoanaerobaculia bacterium]